MSFRERIEDTVDKVRNKGREISRRREEAVERSARSKRDEKLRENRMNVLTGRTTAERGNTRVEKYEQQYQNQKVPLERKAVQVVERTISGAPQAVEKFMSGMEPAFGGKEPRVPRGQSNRGGKGRGRKYRESRGGSESFTGIDFGSLNTMDFSSGLSGLDFDLDIGGPIRKGRRK